MKQDAKSTALNQKAEPKTRIELLNKRKLDQIDLLESTRRQLEKKDPTLSGKHNKPKNVIPR